MESDELHPSPGKNSNGGGYEFWIADFRFLNCDGRGCSAAFKKRQKERSGLLYVAIVDIKRPFAVLSTS
jgi:hypothetical protein